MSFMRRKSPLEKAIKVVASRVDSKVLGSSGLGVVGGVVGTIAASAVISSVRRKPQ